MQIAGPFWRLRPSAATTIKDYAWCYLWLNDKGHVVAIEWCSR